MPPTSPRVSAAVSRLLQSGQISRVDEESGVLQTLHADCPHDGQRASVRRMSREVGGPVMEMTMRCSACFRDFVATPDALYLHPRVSRPPRAAAAPAAKSSAKKAATAAAKKAAPPTAKKTPAKSAPKAAQKTAPKAAKKTAARAAKKAAPPAAKKAAKQATKSAAKAAKKTSSKRASTSRTPAPSRSRRT